MKNQIKGYFKPPYRVLIKPAKKVGLKTALYDTKNKNNYSSADIIISDWNIANTIFHLK